MTLFVTGRNVTPEHLDLIERWLRQICDRVRVDRKTGRISLVGESADDPYTTGCDCLEALIESARQTAIVPAKPDTVPDNAGHSVGHAGGGIARPFDSGAYEDDEGNPGRGHDGDIGTHAFVWIDMTENWGAGYPHGAPGWLILAHELTSGHAHTYVHGRAAQTPEGREQQAIDSENEHRREHGWEERP